MSCRCYLVIKPIAIGLPPLSVDGCETDRGVRLATNGDVEDTPPQRATIPFLNTRLTAMKPAGFYYVRSSHMGEMRNST